MSLKASLRETVGNGACRVLRRDGKIPAILYGPKTEPVKLSIDRIDLEPIFKSGAVSQKLLNLTVPGMDSERKIMIKEMQRHPISKSLLHLDLYEVSMGQKIRVMVPVVAVGKAKGVELGGMLQIIRRELEVLCLPDQITENITIDVTNLNVGESFHVQDLQLSAGIEVPADVNFTILTVLGGKAETAEGEGETSAEAEE